MKQYLNNKGSILPIAIVVSLMGFGMVFGYMEWISHKKNQLARRIAKTRAFYNAETCIAEKAIPYLKKRDFFVDTELGGKEINQVMGRYESPVFSFYTKVTRQIRRAECTGIASYRTTSGEIFEVKDKAYMDAEPQSMAIYMYLTDSELAGGGAFTFDSPGNRRDVTFGSQDKLNGKIQSNGQMVLSNYGGCPDFENAELYLTSGQGGIEFSSACNNYSQLFQGYSNVDTMTMPPVKLPPTGYETLKENATFVYDATIKISEAWNQKDTLIMTRIDFSDMADGKFRVRQWWYLKPPHLKPGISLTQSILPTINELEGNDNIDPMMPEPFDDTNGNGSWEPWEDFTDQNDNGEWDDVECMSSNIHSCRAYIDSLSSFHAKIIDPTSDSPLEEQLIVETLDGPHGFQHFDFIQLDDNGEVDTTKLIIDEWRYYQEPTVIYVKGGQVQVRGTFKGAYTIVTDEFTTYQRHTSFGPFTSQLEDTIWCNIYLIDDLINSDSDEGDMEDYQPDFACMNYSENVMGLVSGANVIIANTLNNGARASYLYDDIAINASILALNESFVMHYWQNTVSSINGTYGVPYSSPPFGDGRGIGKLGGASGNGDYRGYVLLWGGVIQKYRGYMMRNGPGPYDTNDIGMDKNYNYDFNLKCNPPPFFPNIEFENDYDEINVSIIGYGRVN